MKPFDYCVFIGRFSPIHNGHLAMIREAFKQADKVLILIGSVNKARDSKNPWSATEREEMILNALTQEERNNLHVIKIRDHFYNDVQWQVEVTSKVSEIVGESDKVALIGHDHDSSSYYLHMFVQWKFVSMPNFNQFPHATEVREKYFTYDTSYKRFLHNSTVEYLEKFKETDTFRSLKDEFDFIKEYKAKFAWMPYPIIHQTIDSVVIKSGHVLLVRRKGKLGKGLLALPGGFLNADETLKAGALRELKEETAIKVSKEDLEASIIDQKSFDMVWRSIRGRTLSTAFLIDLGSGPLPKVRGFDDAERALWVPIHEIYTRDTEFFEDHWHIITNMISKF